MIDIELDDNMPDLIIPMYNNDAWEFHHRELMDLKYNALSKLKILNQLRVALRKNSRHHNGINVIKNFFSKKDQSVFSSIINDENLNKDEKSLLKLIIDKNIISYRDAIFHSSNSLYKKFSDSKYNSPEHDYLSKYMNLEKTNKDLIVKRINSIIDNSIYLSTPSQLNDPEDCRLNINSTEIIQYARNQPQFVQHVNFFINLFNALAQIHSFALNDPLENNEITRYMWNNYANNYSGIVIKYNLSVIAGALFANYGNTQNNAFPVTYQGTTINQLDVQQNPYTVAVNKISYINNYDSIKYQLFAEAINSYFTTERHNLTKQEVLMEFITSHFFTKSMSGKDKNNNICNWHMEQEFRFVNYDFNSLANIQAEYQTEEILFQKIKELSIGNQGKLYKLCGNNTSPIKEVIIGYKFFDELYSDQDLTKSLNKLFEYCFKHTITLKILKNNNCELYTVNNYNELQRFLAIKSTVY